MPKKNTAFEILPHMDDFLLHIQANNYSEKTRASYERDLLTFDLFLATEMSRLPFSSISKKTLEYFKAYLNSRDRKTAKGAPTDQFLSSGSAQQVSDQQ